MSAPKWNNSGAFPLSKQSFPLEDERDGLGRELERERRVLDSVPRGTDGSRT